jgi:hypothetical protein
MRMSSALIWTSMVWALVVGWSGARVLWFLMSRREYRGHPGRHRVNWGHTQHGVSAAPHRPGQ